VSAILKQSLSRIFVLAFVVIMLSALVWSVTQNWSRRAETESAAAVAQAGQKLSTKKINKDQASDTLEATLKLEPLQVVTSKGSTTLQIELMRTPDELAKGLMFRQSMADNQGMLFDFGTERPVSMWMKNTYLALDMVFVTSDGKIHRIEENTEPHSEKTISSGVNIRAVLEVKAGTTRRLGIKAGDRITHQLFTK
jgi:uncharacterized protein